MSIDWAYEAHEYFRTTMFRVSGNFGRFDKVDKGPRFSCRTVFSRPMTINSSPANNPCTSAWLATKRADDASMRRYGTTGQSPHPVWHRFIARMSDERWPGEHDREQQKKKIVPAHPASSGKAVIVPACPGYPGRLPSTKTPFFVLDGDQQLSSRQ